jgi:hypothetical protein
LDEKSDNLKKGIKKFNRRNIWKWIKWF